MPNHFSSLLLLVALILLLKQTIFFRKKNFFFFFSNNCTYFYQQALPQKQNLVYLFIPVLLSDLSLTKYLRCDNHHFY